jgi:hypothetical protein
MLIMQTYSFQWIFTLGTIKTNGGVGRDRTDDILLAKQALSQLSYDPKLF